MDEILFNLNFLNGENSSGELRPEIEAILAGAEEFTMVIFFTWSMCLFFLSFLFRANIAFITSFTPGRRTLAIFTPDCKSLM
jgi:hypothetical protein